LQYACFFQVQVSENDISRDVRNCVVFLIYFSILCKLFSFFFHVYANSFRLWNIFFIFSIHATDISQDVKSCVAFVKGMFGQVWIGIFFRQITDNNPIHICFSIWCQWRNVSLNSWLHSVSAANKCKSWKKCRKKKTLHHKTKTSIQQNSLSSLWWSLLIAMNNNHERSCFFVRLYSGKSTVYLSESKSRHVSSAELDYKRLVQTGNTRFPTCHREKSRIILVSGQWLSEMLLLRCVFVTFGV